MQFESISKGLKGSSESFGELLAADDKWRLPVVQMRDGGV